MKALVLMANGTEELEAITAIDLWRRSGYDVTVAGTESPVLCARGTKLIPDVLLNNLDTSKLFDLVFLPGGLEGTKNLNSNPKVEYILQNHKQNSKYIAAICAAPMILVEKGLINKNTVITSHPSLAEKLSDYKYTEDTFVIDNHILTSRGAGTAIEFALNIIKLFSGKELANKIANDIVYSYDWQNNATR